MWGWRQRTHGRAWPVAKFVAISLCQVAYHATERLAMYVVSCLAKVDLNDMDTCFRRILNALLNFSVHFFVVCFTQSKELLFDAHARTHRVIRPLHHPTSLFSSAIDLKI